MSLYCTFVGLYLVPLRNTILLLIDKKNKKIKKYIRNKLLYHIGISKYQKKNEIFFQNLQKFVKKNME